MGKIRDYILGGSTTPVAGDGFGYSPQSPTNSSTKSPRLDVTSSFAPGEHKVSPTSSVHSIRLLPLRKNVKAEDDKHQLPHSPNGVGTPKSTQGIDQRASLGSRAESHLSALDPADAAESMSAQEEIIWQDYEIPEELGSVKDDIPLEIRNVVQESLDEHHALRASLIQARLVAVETATDNFIQALHGDDPIVAESSAMAEARPRFGDEFTASSHGTSTATDIGDTSHGSIIESNGPIDQPPSTFTVETVATTYHSLMKLLPAGRSKGGASPNEPSVEPKTHECTSCFDDIPEKQAVKLPCRHSYCKTCFAQLISTSIQHEINFPPKCCLTDVPKKLIRDNLTYGDCAVFNAKALEYAVPIGDRYYCVSASCGKWIDTRQAKRSAGALKCPHCAVKLCTLCRGPQHPSNEDCPQDSNLRTTLEQAERSGWRRCYRCKAMVELNTGCRHITCKCRAEFCYTCGAKWRTCYCTEEDQYRRAEQIRAQLSRFEADQRAAERARRAEEERVRAAAAAVETAERRLQEEREAEDAHMEEEIRKLERKETERLQQITEYFHHLRGVLQRVHSQQRSEIEKRHDKEWTAIDGMRTELDSPHETAKRDGEVNTEREKIIASTATTIKGLQRQHAAGMMDMIARQRREQDELLAQAIEAEAQDVNLIRAEKLQDLNTTQDLERAKLRSEQAGEIKKWKSRGDASLQAFDSRMLGLKMRLEQAEKISKREQEVRNLVFADGKWTETLFAVRYAMLAEDERRIMRTGGEVPAVPKRDESQHQNPTLQLQPQVQTRGYKQVSKEAPIAIVGLLMK